MLMPERKIHCTLNVQYS